MELGGLKLWHWCIVLALAASSSLMSASVGAMLGSFAGAFFILWGVAYWSRRGAGWFKRTLLGESSPP